MICYVVQNDMNCEVESLSVPFSAAGEEGGIWTEAVWGHHRKSQEGGHDIRGISIYYE